LLTIGGEMLLSSALFSAVLGLENEAGLTGRAYPVGGSLLAAVVVLGSAMWAALDSASLQMKKYKGGIDHPLLVFVAVALVWIICFPMYLVTRARLLHGELKLKKQYRGEAAAACEQQARASLRKALLAEDATARQAALDLAAEQVAEALDLCPESRDAAILQFYLGLAEIGLAGDKAQHDDINALAADITRQDPARSDLSLRWMWLACQWLRLVAATPAEEFDTAKEALQGQLQAFVVLVPDEDEGWGVARMRASVEQLLTALNTAEFKSRANVSLDLSAGLD
jgi:hypothetical protein